MRGCFQQLTAAQRPPVRDPHLEGTLKAQIHHAALRRRQALIRIRHPPPRRQIRRHLAQPRAQSGAKPQMQQGRCEGIWALKAYLL